MGKKRATYFMGTIIATLAVTLAFVAIMPAVTESPTASTSLNAMGHLTMKVYDPDGTMVHYIQTDNFISNAAKNSVFAALFSDGTLASSSVFKFLALCAGGSSPFGATTVSQTACDGGAVGAEMTIARLDGLVSAGGTVTTAPTYRAVLTGTITVPVADNDETFGELALFDQSALGGNMFSVADFTDIRLFSNQQVNLKYTITMTG